MKYTVNTIQNKNDIQNGQLFEIDKYMWNSTRSPKTYGWLGYLEEKGFFVKFVCEEQDPKRGYTNHRDRVCDDSAVEVFFAFTEEGESLSNDCMYVNVEMNANGAMYTKFGKGRKNRQFVSEELAEQFEIHTQIEEQKWTLEALIPESFMKTVCDLDAVKAGKTFYCNFYKISEDPAIEHYGTYAPIDSETPNFHLPVCFAEATIQ